MTLQTQPDTTDPWVQQYGHSKEQLDRMLDRVKGKLLFKKGAAFLCSLMCSHRFIWDEKNFPPGVKPTAWCDGETVAFSPTFFLSIPEETRITVLAHELWHTAFDHMSRFLLEERCPDVWNYAADYVINIMLQDQGYTFEGTKPYLDEQYRGMTTEEVYNLLPKNPGQPISQPCDSSGVPTLSGDLRKPGSGSDDDAEGSGDSAQAQAKSSAIKGKIVQAIQAAKMAKEAGTIPGEIEELIKQFLDPVLPWEQLLYDFMNELSQDDYSLQRPNRRHEEYYLPSLMGNNGLEHLIYYIDVSGSITHAQALRFFSEVAWIHQNLVPKRLTIVMFDTRITKEVDFFEDDYIDEIEIVGRGGTSLVPVREHIEKHQPTAAVIFSDMYVTPMVNKPASPILWVVIDNPKAQVNFGRMVHIPADKIGEKS